MDAIDIGKLKYKPDIIKKCFRKSGDTYYCNQDLKVYFPTRYINRKLAVLGNTVKLLQIYIIVDNFGNYAKVFKPFMINLTPNNISEVIMEGKSYQVLEFEKDNIFIPYGKGLKNTEFVYNLFDEFYVKGNIPWFIDYSKVTKILYESNKYTGSKVGDFPLGYEFITSVISRSVDDKAVHYRHIVKDNKNKTPLVYIGLNNVYYSYDSTGAKIFGNYMTEGIIGAIATKEKHSTVVADILRK